MTGSLVINYQYDRVRGFAEGLSPVMEDNKWIFIDKQGNKAIDEEYLDASVLTMGWHRFNSQTVRNTVISIRKGILF